jgi:hypothetical protein
VEAIANLTGVMKKPVYATARRAIWVVTIEVAVFNILLAVCMLAIFPLDRDRHFSDMLAFLSGHYLGGWAELGVRVLGGVLLLSATNTAVTDMISVQYLMARDEELPPAMQSLNRFGVPWVPAFVAAGVPALVLLFSHDLESLAALYAIGVIGAVAINVSLCALHPRLRRFWRKAPMALLAVVLLSIWATLALTKLHALVFVIIVMTVGLIARALTRRLAARRPRPSLLRRAIAEQLPAEVMTGPKIMIGTYGSVELAEAAIAEAARAEAALVVTFVRQVWLSFKYAAGERRLDLDSDLAAQRTFARFLELGYAAGVPIVPVYDTGADAAEVMAENAAIHGCDRILIGSSRQGAVYHLIKGHFQRRLESLLPADIKVQVLGAADAVTAAEAGGEPAGVAPQVAQVVD